MASISDNLQSPGIASKSRNMKEVDNERGHKEARDEERKDEKRYLNHIERTAMEPRDETLHALILTKITPINPNTRLFYLSPLPHLSTSSSPSPSSSRADPSHQKEKLTWRPGQWVDLYLPGIEKPGGYSITNFPRPSAPGTTNNRSDPSILKSEKEKSSTRKGSMEIELEEEEEEPGIELAIQKPVFKSEEEGKVGEQVTWLFRNPEEIMGAELRVRIGGSFVWPPDSCTTSASSALSPQPTNANDENSWRREIDITRVIFIAGGMGINPLMSMIGYINSKLEMREENDGYARESEREREEEGEIRYENLEIQFLYTSKTPAPFNEGENEKEAEIPFLPRLTKIFGSPSPPNQPQPQPQPQPPNPKINWNLHLFLTNTNTNTKTKTPTPPFSTPSTPQIHTHPHRIHPQDIQNAIPQTSHARKKTLIYICGPPAMADEMIGYVNVRGTRNGTGTDCNGDEDAKQSFRIFCERWW